MAFTNTFTALVSSSVYFQSNSDLTWADLKQNLTLNTTELEQWRQSGTGMWTYLNEAIAYPSVSDLMGSNFSTWMSSLDMTSALATAVSAASMDDTVKAGVEKQLAIQQQWAADKGIGAVELMCVAIFGTVLCVSLLTGWNTDITCTGRRRRL